MRFRDWVWANETKDYSFADAERDIENNNELYAKYQSSIPTQHAITITPEMRQQVQEGQPLFQKRERIPQTKPRTNAEWRKYL